MSSFIAGTTANISQQIPLRVKSIILTAADGADAILTLRDYDDANGSARIIVKAVLKTTVQVFFGGYPFSNGVLVDPDANTANFVIEYDGE